MSNKAIQSNDVTIILFWFDRFESIVLILHEDGDDAHDLPSSPSFVKYITVVQ